MGKIIKRFLAIFMIILTLTTSVPVGGLADELKSVFAFSAGAEEAETTPGENIETAEIVREGNLGDDITWTLDAEGKLAVNGDGEMVIDDNNHPWYNYRNDIKTVVIEDGITNVGDYAFYQCSNLVSVVLAESVETIGYDSFAYAFSLKTINLENVKNIAGEAFIYCFELESVSLDSAEYIGAGAFAYCIELKEVSFSEHLKTIGEVAFGYCIKLAEVTIPSSVTTIGDDAFAYLLSLKSIVNNSLTSDVFNTNEFYVFDTYEDATDCAFIMAEYLKLELREDVSEEDLIDFLNKINAELDKDFNEPQEAITYSQELLKGNGFPSYLTVYCTDESSQHESCKTKGITHILFGTEEEHFCFELFGTAGDLTWEIDIDTKTLILSGEGEIPDYDYYSDPSPWYMFSNYYDTVSFAENNNITRIGEDAFSRSCICSITIPASVTEIAGEAFSLCWNLKSVLLEEGSKLTSIEESVFEHCISLESIILPSSLKTIGYEAFYECVSLKGIVIPSSVTSIGSRVFKGCASLTEITVEEGNTTYIAADNMLYTYNKSNLLLCVAGKSGDIVVPKEVSSIDSYAFYNCENIASFSLEEGSQLSSLPEFYGCNSLETVNIPANVSYISSYIFDGCTSLENINVHEDNSNYASNDGVLYNKSFSQLMRCPQSKLSVSIPDTVNTISGGAFEACKNIAEIALPSGVTSIQDDTFKGCSSLKYIVLPESVAEIKYNCFYGCTNLEYVSVLNKECFFYSYSNVFPMSTILKGYSGSTTQSYAFEYGYNFESLDDKVTESITVKSLPKSRKVKLGKSLNHEGLVLTLHFNDGTTADVYSGFKITGFDSSTVGIKTVTVSYGDISTTFEVEVYEYIVPKLELGHRINLIVDKNEKIRLEYTPKVTGDYTFRSFARTNTGYTRCELRDENDNFIDSYSSSGNFSLTATLEAGKKYYWYAGYSGSDSGKFDVLLTAENLDCTHENKETVSAVLVGCTTDGYTEGVYCNDCAYWLSGHEIIYARHIDENTDRVCDVCEKSTLVDTGNYGENITWTLYDNGDLFFDGTGETPSIDYTDRTYDIHHRIIKNAYFSEGITYINNCVLRDYENLKTVTVSNPDCEIFSDYDMFGQNVTLSGYDLSSAYFYAMKYGNEFESLGEAEELPVASESDFNITENEDGTVTIIGYSGSLVEFAIPEKINGKTVSAIEADSFSSSGIEVVEIPSGVKSIGAFAFSNCSSLQYIALTDGLEKIDNSAFENSDSLVAIEIPDSVTSLGTNAFCSCNSLGTALLGNGIKAIESTFYDCDNLRRVSLPSSLESIGKRTFYDCDNLQNIVLPETLKLIDYEAFYSCILQTIEIPESVVSIGYDAFEYNWSLHAYVYNNTCSIGSNAFYGAQAIHAYDGSTAEVYANNYGIKFISFNVTDDGYNFALNEDGESYYIKAYSGTASKVTIPSEFSGLPVTAIGNNAFKNNYKLKSLTIPSTVTSIGEYSFYNCYNLVDFELPATVTSIGSYAFDDCNKLEDVRIYNETVTLGSRTFDSNTVVYGYDSSTAETYAFDTNNGHKFVSFNVTEDGYSFGLLEDDTYCIKSYIGDETELTVPSEYNGKAVTVIKHKAFTDTSVKKIVIPESITSLYNAFDWNLEEIKIYNPECEIDYFVFDSHSSSLIVYGYANSTAQEAANRWDVKFSTFDVTTDGLSFAPLEDGTYEVISYIGNSSDVTIPSEFNGKAVTQIGEKVFKNMSVLNTVTLPSTITKICSYAFYNCYNLKQVNIPENITAIGNNAFEDCSSLSSVIIPGSCKTIGDYAFRYCDSLEIVTIVEGVESIGMYAFYDCSELKTLYVAAKNIGDYAFGYCRVLKDLTISEGVENVGSSTFYYCENLGEAELPSTLIYISNNMFYNCNKLKKLVINGKDTNFTRTDYDFTMYIGNPIPYDTVVYVHEDAAILELLINSYKHECIVLETDQNPDRETTAEDFLYMELEDGTLAITAYVGTPSVVTVPESIDGKTVSAIGYYSYIALYESNYTLCLYPFTVDKRVESVHLPKTINTILEVPLKKISFDEENPNFTVEDDVLFNKDKTTLIRYMPFKEGTSYVIPETVLTVNSNAFYNCTNLKEVTVNNLECDLNSNAFDYNGDIKVLCHKNSKAYRNITDNGNMTDIPLAYLCDDFRYVGHTKVCGGYTIEIETCTYCEYEFRRENTDEFTAHTYDKWVRTTEPTCTDKGYDTLYCSVCNFTPGTLDEVVCDKSTYPESEHNYSDGLDKTYHFSYKEATKLVLKFSSSTYTESNYDKIYIYDGNGNLVNNQYYSGSQLSSKEITVETDSFSIRFTTDSSVTNYGFSFDSIKAYVEKANDEYSREVAPLGHALPNEFIINLHPTCNDKGSKYKECTRCEYVLTEEIEPLGHDFEQDYTVDIEPTCIDDGIESRHCSRCDEKTDQRKIEAIGHKYGNPDTAEPTCIDCGYNSYRCLICDYFYTDFIDPLGHNYAGTVTAPTCTEKGFTTYVCSRCEDTYIDSFVDALDHSYNSVITDPTCTAKGFTTYTCTVCGYSYTDNIVAANGHSYNSVIINPTCTAKGFTTNTCTVCGYSYTDNIVAANGHSYNSVITEPTCTSKGFTTHTCTVCGHSYKDTEVAASGHKNNSVVTAPTCTSEGFTTHTCTVCGHISTDSRVPMVEHNYSAVTTDPTCLNKGYTTYTCNDCGHNKTADYVNALGHDYKSTHFDSTTTEDGYTLYECNRCDYSYTLLDPAVAVDGFVINSQVHKLVLSWQKAKEATVTGYQIYRKAEGEEDFRLHATVNGRNTLTYTDTNVTVGKLYYYQICAIKGNVIGVKSEIKYASPVPDTEIPLVILFKPGDYSIVSNNTKFEIQTQDNIGVARIELLYSDDNGTTWTEFYEKNSATVNNTVSFENVPETDVLVKVLAYDKDGNVSDGKIVRHYKVDKTAPEKVKNVKAIEVYSSSATIQWDNVEADDFAGFVLQLKQGDTYKTISNNVLQLGYHLTGLRPDTSYTYRVAAKDINGNIGEYSDDFTIKTIEDTTAPSVTDVSSSTRCNDSGTFIATIKDDCDIKSVSIQVSVDGDEWNTVNTFTYDDYSLQKNITYTVDFKDYAEGIVKVRAVATDYSGNSNESKSTTPYTDYLVDRTAPAAPKDVVAVGGDGYVYIKWSMNTEEDVNAYSIYRSETEDGEYKCIKSGHKYISFYDYTALENKMYFYKVKVNDTVNNLSDFSVAVSAERSEDITAPKILQIYPSDNGSISSSENKIRIYVADNNAINDITVSLRNHLFDDYATTVYGDLRGNVNGYVEVSLPVSDYEHGDYFYLKAKVSDMSGNESEYSDEYSFIVDKVAPKIENLKATVDGVNVNVSFDSSGDKDVYAYRISLSDSDNKTIDSITYGGGLAKYEHKFTVNKADVYRVSVRAYDNVSNESITACTADMGSLKIAPVAVVSAATDMEIDVQEYFDASKSSDIDGSIYSYYWDFGDGVTSNKMKVAKKYTAEGEYTVTLTVTDNDGISSTVSKKILVSERQILGYLNVNIYDDLGNVVPYVPVTFNLGTKDQYDVLTDSRGVAQFKASEGEYKIGVYVDGKWLPVQKKAIVVGGITNEYTLTITEGAAIEGHFEVKRLTVDEVKALGIFDNPDAETEVFKARVTVGYGESTGVGSYDLDVVTSNGKVVSFKPLPKPTTPRPIKDKKDGGLPRVPVAVEQITTEDGKTYMAVMDIPAQMSYINELFDVRLNIINNTTEDFEILDSTVKLHVPEGLEIVDYLSGYLSSSTARIERINSRQITLKWMLRGKTEGLYNLAADFKGTMSEFLKPVTAHFETKEPIKVYGPSAVNFTFDFDSELRNGAFYFNVGMENVSDIDIIKPQVGITTDELTNIAAVMKAAESKKKLEEAAKEETDEKKKQELEEEAREILLDATRYMNVVVYELDLVLEDASGNKKYLGSFPDYIAPGEKLYNEYVVYGINDVKQIGYFSDATYTITGTNTQMPNVVIRNINMEHYGYEDVIVNFDNIFGYSDETEADKVGIMQAYSYLINNTNYDYWNNRKIVDSETLESHYSSMAEDFGRIVFESFKVVLNLDTSVYSDEELESRATDYITELMTSDSLVEQIKFNIETKYIKYAQNVLSNIGTVLNLNSDNSWETFVKDQKALKAISTELRKIDGGDDLNERLYHALNDTAGAVLTTTTKALIKDFLLSDDVVVNECVKNAFTELTEYTGIITDILKGASEILEINNRVSQLYNSLITIQSTKEESLKFFESLRDNLKAIYNETDVGLYDTRVFRVLYNVTDKLYNCVEQEAIDIVELFNEEVKELIKKKLNSTVPKNLVKDLYSITTKHTVSNVTKKLLSNVYKSAGIGFEFLDRFFEVSEIHKTQDNLDMVAAISDALRRATILTAADYYSDGSSVERSLVASETFMYLRGLVNSRILGEKINTEYEKLLESRLTKARLIVNFIGLDELIVEYEKGNFFKMIAGLCSLGILDLIDNTISSKEIYQHYESKVNEIDDKYQDKVITVIKQRDVLFNSKYTILGVPDAPELSLDYEKSETIQSFSDEYEYCFGDGIWKACDGNPIKFTIKPVNQVLRVRKIATDTEMSGNIAYETIYRQPSLRPQVGVKFDGEKYTVINLDEDYKYEVILSDNAGTSFGEADTIYIITKKDSEIFTDEEYDYMTIRSKYDDHLMVCNSEALTEKVEKPVSVKIHYSGLGRLEHESVFFDGDKVSVKAYPDNGYIFEQWFLDGKPVGNDSVFEFSAYDGAELKAEFLEIVPESVKISAESLTVKDTETASLTAEVIPLNAYDTTVTWSSSNENVAVVDENGKITPVGVGEAIITATAKYSVSANCTVTVVHEHTFGQWSTQKEASCIVDGVEVRACRCNETETRPISAKGHDYKSTVTAPTCTTDGYTTNVCAICADSYISESIDKLGHDMGKYTVVSDATCIEKGSEKSACTRCDHYVTREISAKGHNYSSVITEPTCVSSGYTTYTCTECGDSYVSDEISATGHKYSSVITAPSCSTEGYTTYTCICGDAYVSDTVKALGHNWTVSGNKKTCNKCSTVIEIPSEPSTVPSTEVTTVPSIEVTTVPSTEVTTAPSIEATTVPSTEVTTVPSTEATTVPSTEVTTTPSTDATTIPSTEETTVPTVTEPHKHTEVVLPSVDATYTKSGKTEGKMCSECGEILVAQKKVSRKKLKKVTKVEVKKTTTSSVKLSWSKVTGADSYKVYYSTNGKKWKSIKVKKNTATIKKLKSGRNYQFRVRAYVGKYYGAKSSIVKTSTRVKKAVIKSLKSSKKSTAVVTWKKVARATGYVVEYSTSKKFTKKTTKKVTVKNSKILKVTLKKLKRGKKYYVRVKAYKTVNKKAVYGLSSKVKTVKIK